MAILMHTNKPKILIPEKVSPDGLALLKGQFEVDEKKGLSPEELKSIIGDYEALIVRSETKVTADLLNAAKKLKVIDPSPKPRLSCALETRTQAIVARSLSFKANHLSFS
jgi:hypothetical protein